MEALLKKEIIANKAWCHFIGICVFVILTSLGAFVRIPLAFTPVPVTLQTFFVLLSGAFLGRRGSISQIAYCLLGISGLSLFSGSGSGLLYILGPTGGYILGFIPASFLIAKLLGSKEKNIFAVFSIFCLGDLVILLSGTAWLKVISGFPISKLLYLGFIPFIGVDLLKAASATFVYKKLENRLKEIF